MVNPEAFVELIHDFKEKLKWHHQSDTGGFVADFGAAAIHIIGSSQSRITLSITHGRETYHISEPMPMEAAPLGRWVEAFKTKIIGRAPTEFPPEIQKSIRIKRMLNEILAHANKKYIERSQDPSSERKLRQHLWNILTEEANVRK